MKVMIDIPQEFKSHFNEDRFKDSLLRLKADANYGFEHGETISGIYEIELLDMLTVAFEEARIIESSQSNYDLCPSFFAEDYVDPR